MNTETNPSESTHPTDVLSHKTETTPSWLKPLILVNKYAAGRPIPLPPTALLYQPEKSRPFKLKEQKVWTYLMPDLVYHSSYLISAN
jgi:hypothetical protein